MSLDAELRAAQRAGDKERVLALRARRGDKLTDLVWTTKDKREVRIVDMDDLHLVNSIRYLARRRLELAEAIFSRTPVRFSKETERLAKALMVEAKQRGLDVRPTEKKETA